MIQDTLCKLEYLESQVRKAMGLFDGDQNAFFCGAVQDSLGLVQLLRAEKNGEAETARTALDHLHNAHQFFPDRNNSERTGSVQQHIIRCNEFISSFLMPMEKAMRLWWIEKPMVMGSSNPTTENLRELHEKGLRTVFSLLDESEQHTNYDPEQVESLGIRRHSVPVRDFTAPTLELFDDFLGKIEQVLTDGSVLIHCQGGSGRTGTMAAAYWISKGLSADEAIRRVRQAKPNAIETQAQEESLHQLEVHLKSSHLCR